ncbi:MAG: zinc transporter ZntB [Chromatiaceae bacterium]|nr:zinc transporter ZntB [Gammaproteobacteria bacterium]MCB1861127.1 zinc transporter ZntB [Gammaproteobacteria bacterium]MCB1881153.1 zinc transporter ZntB [Gammaproteobacteria bacterium]MCB1903929.1 zinc transporter ZntB [Gammaproteobacteria bacterium]MCP5445687.1 zinc transporter ZntB [Chromatiaceae bacterium]
MTNNDGLLNAYLLDGKGGGRQMEWSDIRNWTPEQGALWVHLDFTKQGTHQWLEQESGLDPLIAEALIADETRPRCAAIDGGLLLSLRGVNSNPGSEPEDMVSVRLFCTGERVISTRRRQLLSITDLVEALERGDGPRTLGDLTAILAERLIERMISVINELEERIDDMEENIIMEAGQESRGNILDLRREIIMLRRYIAPQRDAMNKLSTVDAAWLGKKNRHQLRESSDTITRHVEDLDSARDRASVAYEELSSRLSEQMNSRMYVLSLVAGLFLPLGFLTGLLGVNVGGIPLADNPWGFLEVVVFLTFLVVVQVVVFRRKKWF